MYLKSHVCMGLDLIKKEYIYHSLNKIYLKNAFALLLLLFFNSSFSQELPPINFFTPKVALRNYVDTNHFLDLNKPLLSWKLGGA